MAEIKRVIVDTISSQIIARLKQVQSDAEPFVNDNAPDIKSTRMTLKMTINKKISQISPNCAITKKIVCFLSFVCRLFNVFFLRRPKI